MKTTTFLETAGAVEVWNVSFDALKVFVFNKYLHKIVFKSLKRTREIREWEMDSALKLHNIVDLILTNHLLEHKEETFYEIQI